MSDLPSIMLTPRVSFASGSDSQLQPFTVLCTFVEIVRNDTCAVPLQHDQEVTSSTSATPLTAIASSALALAVAAGEH